MVEGGLRCGVQGGLDSYEEVAAQLHIKNPATLNRWVKEYQEKGTSAWETRRRGRPSKPHAPKRVKNVPLESAETPEMPLETAETPGMQDVAVPAELGETEMMKPAGNDVSLFIAMACSGRNISVRNWKLPPDVYPVLGGAALTSKRPQEMSYDDFGKNISKEYPLYAELAVTYWLHKNAPMVDYLGICDEHRCFLLTGSFRKALEAKDVDVILPRTRIQMPDIKSCFNPSAARPLQRHDCEQMLEVLDTKEPEMAACARHLFQQEFDLPSNLLIARRDIFHGYAAFLFSVLEAVRQRNKADKFQQEPRSLAALGEILTSIYFAYHRELTIKHAHIHLMA